ncbi:TPA: hypothetical protein PXP47_003642, partial [Yersinia enterocolitica]|nr:hypothetical protein [Yersinia enterocolitica]
ESAMSADNFWNEVQRAVKDASRDADRAEEVKIFVDNTAQLVAQQHSEIVRAASTVQDSKTQAKASEEAALLSAENTLAYRNEAQLAVKDLGTAKALVARAIESATNADNYCYEAKQAASDLSQALADAKMDAAHAEGWARAAADSQHEANKSKTQAKASEEAALLSAENASDYCDSAWAYRNEAQSAVATIQQIAEKIDKTGI